MVHQLFDMIVKLTSLLNALNLKIFLVTVQKEYFY